MERFLARLPAEAPPLATVERVTAEQLEELGELGFSIRESPAGGEPRAAVTPDSATCADCLAELFDPADRRFRYPFSNCTNCGPRFTIVRDVPYDRPNTTMAGFAMCAGLPRRVRATRPTAASTPSRTPAPSAGRACGSCTRAAARSTTRGRPIRSRPPRVRCWTARSSRSRASAASTSPACADDEEAVAELRARKHREDKPFALMAPDLAAARELVALSAAGGGAAAVAGAADRAGAAARRTRAWRRRWRRARRSSA